MRTMIATVSSGQSRWPQGLIGGLALVRGPGFDGLAGAIFGWLLLDARGAGRKASLVTRDV